MSSSHQGKIEASKKSLTRKRVFLALAVFVGTIPVANAQGFKTLVTFNGSNGSNLTSGVVQGTDANFYGVTVQGGTNNEGTAFKVTPEGKLTTLYNFCEETGCTDGSGPSGLMQAIDGNFYGTTGTGGTAGDGIAFRMSPAGKIQTLHNFCATGNCSDGVGPDGLVQVGNGNLYGVTTLSQCPDLCGTLFELSTAGELRTLYDFCSECSAGYYPSPLTGQAANGDFYGTTEDGGDYGYGTVFKATPQGDLTTLYSFCEANELNCPDGSGPVASPVQGANGNFYGTTFLGGVNSLGTIYEVTAEGALKTLYAFCSLPNCADGDFPASALLLATDGNFYGTTVGGGANGDGTIFRLTPTGKFTTLYSLAAIAGDGGPFGGLIQATNGTFYGTTGGYGSNGTVFSFSIGLGPFVETRPVSGAVGTTVIILGNNLTSTTAVSFNDTASQFTVVSPSEITTTVPEGATTGKISVVTSGGTLVSNIAFRVEE